MIVIPDEGKIWWAKRSLYQNSSGDNITLKLYKNDITPSDADNAGTYQVADFTGYADKVLTSSVGAGFWAVPIMSGGVAVSSYGTIATWTATSDQTLFGWYMLSSDNKVVAAQRFDMPRSLIGANNDQLSIPPRMQFNDF